MKKVIILGAGLAGLSSGLVLSNERDYEVVLIEKEKKVGGLARSINWDKNIVDIGSHAFRTESQDILREVKELCGKDISMMRRKSSIWMNGSYINYPPGLRDLLFKIPLGLNVKFISSFLKTIIENTFLKNEKSATFQEWTQQRFGSSLAKQFFDDYAEKTWGLPARFLDAELARRKIAISGLGTLLKKVLFKCDENKFYHSQFYYPKRGIGMIPEAMAQAIIKCGGKIHLNSEVDTVEVNKNCVLSIRYKDYKNREEEISADFVISTLPLEEFVSCIVPQPPSQILTISQSLKSRALIMCYLKLKKSIRNNDTWLYFPQKDILFNRIYCQRKYSPVTVDDAADILCVEITCQIEDDIWRLTNNNIYKEVISQLEKIKLIDKKNIDGYFATREKYAYPVYEVGYKKKLKEIVHYLSAYKNFISNGRQGLFNYNNMDHSIQMGFVAARYVLSGIEKGQSWFHEIRQFDDFRIVD